MRPSTPPHPSLEREGKQPSARRRDKSRPYETDDILDTLRWGFCSMHTPYPSVPHVLWLRPVTSGYTEHHSRSTRRILTVFKVVVELSYGLPCDTPAVSAGSGSSTVTAQNQLPSCYTVPQPSPSHPHAKVSLNVESDGMRRT